VTDANVLVVGHPYIDVWEAVKPSSVGIPGWPSVPRGQDWKTGVCRALGWEPNTGAAWQRILSSVRSYKDLQPELLGIWVYECPSATALRGRHIWRPKSGVARWRSKRPSPYSICLND
jgi:hypothetical protein